MEISVVIPVYNAEKYVEDAVRSALRQNQTAEVILVEDNSPDNALKVCERLAKEDPRVRVLRHSDGKNHGAGESRNLGIKNARCDYIAFLDADDYWKPRFLEVIHNLRCKFPQAGIYATNYEVVKPNGERMASDR